MKACVIYGSQDLRIEERPLPEPTTGHVRLRMGGVGICGSDLHYYHQGRVGNAIVREPMVLGHEISGVIDAIGPNVQGLECGQHVVVNPSDECGVCPACKAGRQHLCTHLRYYGSAARTPHVQGVMCEFPLVQARQCLPIDAHVPFEQAACVEPLAIALHAVLRAGSVFGKHVFISGAGPVGCLAAAVARLHGACCVTISDMEAFPLSVARAMGAHTTVSAMDVASLSSLNNSFEVCIEASGALGGLQTCLNNVAPGGTVVQVGFLPAEEVLCPINTALIRKEVNLAGSLRAYQEFPLAVQLIQNNALNMSNFITATYPLHEAKKALLTASDKTRSMKVVLTGTPQ